MGATAGRTTLLGEGLQHQDGHSLVLASTVPPCQAYDPAFAYEVATIVQAGIQRMYGPDTPAADRDVFYYVTLYNENYPMPAMPEGLDAADISDLGIGEQALADGLLQESGVAVLPGTAFGSHGKGYLRLSYANSVANIDRALERIAAHVGRLERA